MFLLLFCLFFNLWRMKSHLTKYGEHHSYFSFLFLTYSNAGQLLAIKGSVLKHSGILKRLCRRTSYGDSYFQSLSSSETPAALLCENANFPLCSFSLTYFLCFSLFSSSFLISFMPFITPGTDAARRMQLLTASQQIP